MNKSYSLVKYIAVQCSGSKICLDSLLIQLYAKDWVSGVG